MSAIYGYSLKKPFQTEDYTMPLMYWNHTYGKTEADCSIFEACDQINSMGSVLSHLSDNYPAGPAVLKTQSYYAVMDVVLYNREELAEKLSLKQLSDISDEQLLLQWIATKSFDSLAEVRGDYAGAVYSREANTITLFRDHTGVRPLYYYIDQSIFAFSTDLRGLTAIPITDTTLNEEIFFEKMMGYNELTLDQTDYQNIHCVVPAHYMTVKSASDGFEVSMKQYWKLGSRKIRLARDEDYANEMCRLITEAIEVRAKAVTGVVGAELSGGLDSGVISTILNRTGHVSCYYCWSYDPSLLPLKEVDERKVVLDICRQENITCHFRQKNYQFTQHTFDYGIENYDVPFLNTLMVSEGAGWMGQQGAKVVLCGYGGDEGVSHRSELYEMWYNHEYLAYVKAVYRNCTGRSHKVLRTIKRTMDTIVKKRMEIREPFDLKKPSREYLNTEFRKNCQKKYPARNFQFKYNPVHYILSGGPRIRMDVSAVLGMEAGVQYMFPYMDYRVLDYAVSIPRHLYNDGITDRLVYRKAFRHMIPDSLYELTYKNMPSLVDSSRKENTAEEKPDMDAINTYLRKRRDMILTHLDRDYWAAYLNFEKINQIGEKPTLTAKEYQDAYETLNELVYCAYLQNAGTNIKEHTYDV